MRKFNIKAAGASVAGLAIAGAGLVAFAGTASAASTAPPFEPDTAGGVGATGYGQIVFYDAQGNVITSGNDLNHPFAFAVGATASDPGVTQFQLTYAFPQNGVATALWGVSNENSVTPSSPVSAGGPVPADVQALVATNPVVDGSGTLGNASSIINAESGRTEDPTPGYGNVIQVRETDSGPGSAGNLTFGQYWESDIAFNEGTSPITVLGVTVAPGTWQQVFPSVTTTTTSLTTNAPSGGVAPGTPIKLTATSSDTSAAGTLNFFDGTTLIGSAPAASGSGSFTYTPSATENASFTASFVPTLGDIQNPNTANATMVSSSTSAAQAVTVAAPKTATSVTLAADNTSIASGGTVNLTATASGTTAGSVQFFDGSTSLGTAATNASGVATLATSSLKVGANSITAVFTPTDTADFSSSTSSPVVVTEAAPAIFAQNPNSTGNVNVSVSAGTLTVTSGFTTSNPLVLTPPVLSTDGTYLSSTTPFKDAAGDQLTVTDSLAGNPGWTLSASSTNLTDGAGHSIAASGLGLTGLKLDASGLGTITTTDAPAHNPSPVDTDTNSGLASTAANPNGPVIATAAAGNGAGTTIIEGTVGLDIPTSTPAGTYTGSLVFTAV